MEDCWINKIKVGDTVSRVEDKPTYKSKKTIITKVVKDKYFVVTDDKERFSLLNSFLLYDNRGHRVDEHIYIEPVRE